MPFTMIDMLYGGLVPAVVALATWFVARRVLKEDAAARYAPSLAIGIGFSVGYWLVWWKEDHGYWLPKLPYDWLPIFIAAAAIVGPVVHARGVSWFERLLTYAIFGLAAAWFLVPTRPALQPVRHLYILGFGPALGLVALLFDGICERFRGPLLPGLLTFTAMCTSIILLLSGSTSFALTAGAGAAALGGMTISMMWTRDAKLKGLSLAFCTLLGGAMLVGRFNTLSTIPTACYFIVPLAPLLMWCAVCGPLSNGTGFVGSIKKVALPVIASLVAVGMAVIVGFSTDG